MAKTFKLEIVTPEKLVFSDEIVSLVVPAEEGYLGVLAGHAPLLAALKPGEIRIRRESGDQIYATSGGFMEVLPKKTSILCESAEPPETIDTARAEKAKQRAKDRLAHPGKDLDRERAESSVERAENRIRVAKKKR
jgi:F-type H+-transporting ATPase subunit epsilon